MPMPVNKPKVRTDTISNTINEKNPSAAMPPAVNITGPTLVTDEITAA